MCAKVLHARVVSGGGGGPDKTVLNSPRYLASRGYSGACAFLRHPGDVTFGQIEARAKQWEVPVLAVDDRGAFDWRVASRLLSLCREQAVSIWHGHDYKTNLLGLWLARRYPLRLVSTVHGWVDLTMKMKLYYALDRWALKSYLAVVCVSEDLVEACIEAGIPKQRIHCIPNAIDTEDFVRRSPRETLRAAEGLPDGRRVVAAVGRLSPEKGFNNLLVAVARVIEAGGDVELRLAGEGRSRAELERAARQLGIADRVHFVGLIADPRPLYELADVFVSSSLREGLPNVVLEAMAYGLPVLATKVAGVPDVVEHGTSGLLVLPDDLDGLTAGLSRLVRDPSLCGTLGRRGRQLAEEKWSFAGRMERMIDLYDEVMKCDPRPGLNGSRE